MAVTILEKWREILVAVGGILVVALQIINTLLSQDVENQLGKTRDQLLQNSETLVKNRDQLLQNSQKLADKIDSLRAVDEQMNGEIETFGKQLTEHVQASRRLVEALQLDGPMPRVSPIPRSPTEQPPNH